MSRTGVPPMARPVVEPGRVDLLESLFAVCLGVVLAVMLGVGVTTVHPDPAADSRARLEVLASTQLRAQSDLPPQEQIALEQQIRDLRVRARAEEDSWSAEVGAVVVALSGAVMVGALGAGRMGVARVLVDGLLVAGGLSMVYGTILTLMSAQSWFRLAVLLAAGLVTATVGRLRFFPPRVPR